MVNRFDNEVSGFKCFHKMKKLEDYFIAACDNQKVAKVELI